MKLPNVSKKMIREAFQVSLRTHLFHWSLAVVAILVFGFIFLVGPMESKTQQSRKEALALREKVEKILLIGQGNPDMEVVLTRLNDEYDLLKSKVLRKNEQAKVISLLTQTMEDLNMEVINISPQVQTEKLPKVEDSELAVDGVIVRPVLFRLEVVSRYKTLAVFFERLKHAPLLFTIEEFATNIEPAIAPYLQVEMIIAAYEEWTL